MCPIINVVFFYFQVLHWAPLARSRRAFRSVSDCEYVSFKKKIYSKCHENMVFGNSGNSCALVPWFFRSLIVS